MQLHLPAWHPPRSRGSFGCRPCRMLRVRILAGDISSLPRSWQRKWIVQRIIATPPWADFVKIKAVYDEAARLTFETGIYHDVDHEIPLNHPLVCGLHVHNNLRPFPAKANNAKSNRYCPEQMELFE